MNKYVLPMILCILGLVVGLVASPGLVRAVRTLQFTSIAKAENEVARLLLASSKGVCTGEAKEARHEPKNGSGEAVMGCWLPIPEAGVVQVAFTDGEIARVPMVVFEKVDKP